MGQTFRQVALRTLKDRGIQLADSASSNETPISLLGAQTLLSRMGIYGLGFLASLLIARALGPEGRGAYHLPVTVVTITYYLVNLGTDQAQYRLWSTEAAPRRLLPATGVTLGISLGLVGAGILFLIRILWSNSFLAGIPLQQLAVAVAALPFMVHGLLLGGLAILRGDLTRMNMVSLAAAFVQTVAIFVLFQKDAITVMAVLLVWAITVTIPWVLMLPTAAKTGPLFPPSIQILHRQLLLGIRYAPYILFSFLILRIDVLFVAHIVGLEGVGLYSVAILFPEMVWMVTDSLAYPVSNRQANLPDDDAAGVTILAVRLALLLATAGSLVIAGLAEWLIPFAYGDAFGPATAVVWLLTPGVVGLAIWRTLNPYLVRSQAPWVPPTITGTALLSNVVLNLILIPRWGITGAAAASSISYALGAALAARTYFSHAGRRPRDIAPSREDLMMLWAFCSSVWSMMRRSRRKYARSSDS